MQFHLVLGEKDCLHQPIETVVEQAIQGGVTHIQLREKTASTRHFLAVGQRLKKILAPRRIPLLINDRLDIALALDADGVHLGQSDLPYPIARTLLGPSKIIGLTVENVSQALLANTFDVDYIGVGPVFTTTSKQDAPPTLGLSGLSEIVQLSNHPVIAIGGIHAANIKEVLATHVEGVAVISAITHASHPELATRQLRDAFKEVKQ